MLLFRSHASAPQLIPIASTMPLKITSQGRSSTEYNLLQWHNSAALSECQLSASLVGH